ncbi:MAG TPA: hypothetical protein VKE94_12510, partial [Gemmataceae bacterium]|nr:hypothetical protein [Gemmataceae bacterium]
RRERLRQHVHDAPPALGELNPTVPAALAAIIHRMLAKAPARRYQTALAALKDLVELDGSPWAAFERQLLARTRG